MRQRRRLNDRLLVQRATTTPDDAGGQSVSWADLKKEWGHVQPVRSREVEHEGRQVGTETYTVTLRYETVVTELDRLVWKGKTLNVSGPLQDRDGDRRYVTCECEVGTGAS